MAMGPKTAAEYFLEQLEERRSELFVHEPDSSDRLVDGDDNLLAAKISAFITSNQELFTEILPEPRTRTIVTEYFEYRAAEEKAFVPGSMAYRDQLKQVLALQASLLRGDEKASPASP